MNQLQVPEFKTYEEEAAFWDNLDTADFMEDDGEWFRFETANKRAIRVAILPEVADELLRRVLATRVKSHPISMSRQVATKPNFG